MSALKYKIDKNQDRQRSTYTQNLSTWDLIQIGLKPNQYYAWLSLFFIIITGTIVLSLGYGLKLLIDQDLIMNNLVYINQGFIFLLLMSVLLAISAYGRVVYTNTFGQNFTQSIRNRLLNHVLTLDRTHLDLYTKSYFINCLNTDIQQIFVIISQSTGTFIRSCIQLIGGLGILLIISFKLTFLVLIVVPCILLPIGLLSQKMRTLSQKLQKYEQCMQDFIEQTCTALSDIQLFENEPLILEKMKILNKKIDQAFQKSLLLKALLISLVIVSVFTAVSLISWLGLREIALAHLSSTYLSCFIFYAIVVAGSLNQITELMPGYHILQTCLSRMVDILKMSSALNGLKLRETEQTTKSHVVQDNKSLICVQNIDFTYASHPEKPILKNISFMIENNSTVAIVGPSGAGKTTLFQLLTRTYDPQMGAIYIRQQNLRHQKLDQTRALFSVVSQDSVIFNASIYDNIAFGNPSASINEIYQAASYAFVDEFALKMSNGFQTMVGAYGQFLSSGQRQRIAIARAFLRQAPILLMDEAINALDALSEQLVRRTLNHLMKNRTTLIIAHRLSTVMNADNIIVLNNGQIVQQGTHQCLVQDPGLYQSLAEAQFFC